MRTTGMGRLAALATVVAFASAVQAARCPTDPAALAFGGGTTVVTTGLDGRVASTTVLVTECGASLTFAAGTDLRTADGVALTGPVRVTVKDFKSAKNLAGVLTAEAGLLVTFALDAPTGADTKVESATVDPPARLLLPPVATDGPRYRAYTGAFADGSPWLGKRKPTALAARDHVVRMPVLAGRTVVDGSGPVLFDAVDAAPAVAPLGAAAQRSNRIPIPPGDAVQYVSIVNEGTSQVVAVMTGGANGTPDLEPGETEISGGGAFTASVVEIDGQRYLEIGGTATGGDLTIQYRLRSQGTEGSEDHRESAPGTGGGDESDPDAVYDGFIDITIIGCGSIDALERFDAARDTIAALGIEVHTDTFDSTSSGFTGAASAHGVSDSVQEVAARLPPDWSFEFGNRSLTITLPCPEPVVFAISPPTVHAIDFELTEIDRSGAQPHPLVVFDPDGPTRFLGVDDAQRLVTIDPETLVGTQTRIAAAGVDAHAAMPLVFVTAPGKITAYEEETLRKAWAISLPGKPALTSPVTSADGSRLFVRAPGDVLVVDVLRERVVDHIAIPGTGRLALHPEQPLLAALDPDAGQVWITSLPGIPQPFGAGANPSDATWMPDQPVLMVTSFGDDQLRFLPAGDVVSVPDGPSAVVPIGGDVFFLGAQQAGVVQRVDRGVPRQLAVPGVRLLEVRR